MPALSFGNKQVMSKHVLCTGEKYYTGCLLHKHPHEKSVLKGSPSHTAKTGKTIRHPLMENFSLTLLSLITNLQNFSDKYEVFMEDIFNRKFRVIKSYTALFMGENGSHDFKS